MRTLKQTRTAIPVLLLSAAALLAGCATSRIAWDKAGATQAERELDENACLRAAIGLDGGGVLVPYCIDRDVYTRCMETRGYTVRSK
jgi:hypothetical protein